METLKFEKMDDYGRNWQITEEDGFFHVYLNDCRRVTHTHISISKKYVDLVSQESPHRISYLDSIRPKRPLCEEKPNV